MYPFLNLFLGGGEMHFYLFSRYSIAYFNFHFYCVINILMVTVKFFSRPKNNYVNVKNNSKGKKLQVFISINLEILYLRDILHTLITKTIITRVRFISSQNIILLTDVCFK